MSEPVGRKCREPHILLVNYVCAVRVYNLVRKFAYGGCSGTKWLRKIKGPGEGTRTPKFIPGGDEKCPSNTDHQTAVVSTTERMVAANAAKKYRTLFVIPHLYHCFSSPLSNYFLFHFSCKLLCR